MFSRLAFLASVLFCSLSASATVVNIDYMAHITETSGDGLGYTLGDQIDGHFVIDTSKAEGDTSNSSVDSFLFGSVTSKLLQSNFASDQTSDYIDFVWMFNNSEYSHDQLNLTKVLSVNGSVLESLGSSFYFPGLDWINDLSLSNVNLDFSDAISLADSDGYFARFDMAISWSATDIARFKFDSVKIASVSVPEPAPLTLFAVGVIALIIRRRMNLSFFD